MSIIPLGIQDWGSLSENHVRFRLHNMYLAANPTTPDNFSRISRPTLTLKTNIGSGPIVGMWRQENTFQGDWVIVSGTELYRYKPDTNVATKLGDVPGVGYCQIDGTDARVVVVRGGTAYATDGMTTSIIIMPDDVPNYDGLAAPVGSVAVINGYFLLSVLGTQRFYWINPGDTDPDSLSFSSAERIPDSIISIRVVSDEVWFVGASGPEVWSTTGDQDAPFQRINGRVYSDGCLARDTCINVVANNLPAIVWVTDTRSVVVAQGQITKISDESIEEILKTGNNLRAWFFRHNRHDFYVLTADEYTLVYDATMQTWAVWDSYLAPNWLAHLGLQTTSGVFAGDSSSSNVWMLAEGVSDGLKPVIREVSGLVENQSNKTIPCTKVYVKVNAGWSPVFGFEPQLELRWSDDQGGTWSDYVRASLGDKGSYSTSVEYRSLGKIERPGRIFEFRFADFARLRLDYASLNED